MFNQSIWQAWETQELKNYKVLDSGEKTYKKKRYLHFDRKFWFPERKDEIKQLVINQLFDITSKSYWSFSPFIKMIIKTPRFRYQEELDKYRLDTKKRPICFASHKDSLIFSYYSYFLNILYQGYIKKHNFNDCVSAYRSDLDGKCNIQFAKDVFDYIKIKTKEKGECVAITLDITGYFDNIDHLKLKESWLKIVNKDELREDQFRIYKSITQYKYVNRLSIFKKYATNIEDYLKKYKHISSLLEIIPGKLTKEKFERLKLDRLIVVNKSKKGIPQGSPISSTLSNIYLIDFDENLYSQSLKEDFFYRRYCDDLIIVCSKSQASNIIQNVRNEIATTYKLTINEKKTEQILFSWNYISKKISAIDYSNINISNKKKKLQYLGFEYSGEKIYIRSSSLSRYFIKMTNHIVQTIQKAYGRNGVTDKIFIKKSLEKYTSIGKNNFLTYAYNSSRDKYKTNNGSVRDGLNSPAIRKQVQNHIIIFKRKFASKNIQKVISKNKKGIKTGVKNI